MSTNHNRIKVVDLEKNQPNKILKTNQNGELEFSDAENNFQPKLTEENFGAFQSTLSTVNTINDADKMPFLIGSLARMITWANFKSLFKTVGGNSIFGSGNIVTPDMDTTAAQTVSGVKTFLNLMLGLRNAANTFTSFITNTATASRTWTFPDKNGTIAMLSDLGSQSDTRTLYIHSIAGNDSSAIIGNPSKPFQTTAGAIASLPVDNGETYKFFYQNNVVHNVTVQIPHRNLVFEGNTYGNSSIGILQSSSIVDLNFTSLGGTYTNIIDTSIGNGSKFDTRIAFSKLKISSTYTGNLRIGDQASLIIADEIGIDFRSSNSVFNLTSVVGVIDKLYWSGTGTSSGAIFNGVGLERAWINNLEIREFIIANNNNVYLVGEVYSFYNVRIGRITGTTTGIVTLTYGTANSNGLIKLTIGNITLNGKVYLSNQSSSNDVFHFENTTLSANTQLNTGESQGVITGNLNIKNTVGLSANFERNGSILQFINFKGKINLLNKYVANSVFIFKDSSFDLTTNLFDIQVTPNNNTLIFIGVNVFKQSTIGALIKNTISSNFSIEKQGINAITTNATSLASSGTVTVDNTTPINY